MTDFSPSDETEVADLLTRLSAAGETVEICGHGSKRGFGRAVSADHRLDVGKFSGVTLYEPDELVLAAKVGTPLAEITRLLDGERQNLAFEPMDMGPLFGQPAGRGTLGGLLACNLSGPRRVKAGAARDHALGVRAVSGDGRPFKSGGRVVKNVTGYDLSRGLAGSWGTLAVFTELTFKVLPKPEGSTTLVVFGLDDRAAIDLLCSAMGSPWEVSSAAHLPAEIAGETALGAAGRAATLLRLEGFEPSVAYRSARLTESFPQGTEFISVAGEVCAGLWAFVRDARFFVGTDKPLWRVSVAPMQGPDVLDALAGVEARHFYDWCGGLVWIEMREGVHPEAAARVRIAASRLGGHATLVRGSDALGIPAFQPQPDGLSALAARLKKSFDPQGILNPGRMG